MGTLQHDRVARDERRPIRTEGRSLVVENKFDERTCESEKNFFAYKSGR